MLYCLLFYVLFREPDRVFHSLVKGETFNPRDIHLCWTYKRRRNALIILDEKRCWNADYRNFIFETSLKKGTYRKSPNFTKKVVFVKCFKLTTVCSKFV